MTRVVLIEDDQNVRKYIKSVLQKDTEFKIVGEEWDGKRGLELVCELKPDLIILDMEMPTMDGIELLQELEKRRIRFRILVLSCHDEYEYVRPALKLGANDYLIKHKIDEETLLYTIYQLDDSVLQEEKDITLIQDIKYDDTVRKEVKKAIDYVTENYMHEITLEEIAKHVCVSRTYFCSIFKKAMGQQFSIYLLEFRLKKACELLRESDYKVYNIAYEVGFRSHNYFNNIFKKYYGMTPKEYKNQYQNIKK